MNDDHMQMKEAFATTCAVIIPVLAFAGLSEARRSWQAVHRDIRRLQSNPYHRARKVPITLLLVWVGLLALAGLAEDYCLEFLADPARASSGPWVVRFVGVYIIVQFFVFFGLVPLGLMFEFMLLTMKARRRKEWEEPPGPSPGDS